MVRIFYIAFAFLALLNGLVDSGLPNTCENYLLLYDVVPTERVQHPIERNSHELYKEIVQKALNHPSVASSVVVDAILNFETEAVRGYHYFVKFQGTFYDTDPGPCYIEWVHIPFVPGMPKPIKDVDCRFDIPSHYNLTIVPASTPEPRPDEDFYYEEPDEGSGTDSDYYS